MAFTLQESIVVLSDLHQAFSDYINETTPPANNDIQYQKRTRWFNRGRRDIAKRWFFPSLYLLTTLPVTAGNAGPYQLPQDLNAINALRLLQTQDGLTAYTDPYNANPSVTNQPVPINGRQPTNTVLLIDRNFTTGGFQLTFNPAPQTSASLTLGYFASPPLLVNPTDLVLLDGDAVLFFALAQYHYSLGNYTDMEIARQEYENRVGEVIEMELINPPGSVTASANLEQSAHVNDERSFYSGNTRKNP